MGLLAIFPGLTEIMDKVLNHLHHTWFEDTRWLMMVPFDQVLIINLVRTSVDLWVNDIEEIRKKTCTIALLEVARKIRDTNCQFTNRFSDHIAKKAVIRAAAIGWPEAVQSKVQFELQGIFQPLVGVLVKSVYMLGHPWSHREVRDW